MSLNVCPAAIIAAPVEVVWENLVQWERYAGWADVQAEHVEPEGLVPGQTIHFAGKALGSTLRFIFKVEEVDPARHQIALHAFFPFRLQEKVHVACNPIDGSSCRVQYG